MPSQKHLIPALRMALDHKKQEEEAQQGHRAAQDTVEAVELLPTCFWESVEFELPNGEVFFLYVPPVISAKQSAVLRELYTACERLAEAVNADEDN